MKHLIITTLIFLFFSNYVKSQSNYLNTSVEHVRESMETMGWELVATGKTNDGMKKFIAFSLKPRKMVFYFDMNGDMCTDVREIEPKSLLPEISHNLKTKYIKISNSVWESFDNKVRIIVDNQQSSSSVVVTYCLKN